MTTMTGFPSSYQTDSYQTKVNQKKIKRRKWRIKKRWTGKWKRWEKKRSFMTSRATHATSRHHKTASTTSTTCVTSMRYSGSLAMFRTSARKVLWSNAHSVRCAQFASSLHGTRWKVIFREMAALPSSMTMWSRCCTLKTSSTWK